MLEVPGGPAASASARDGCRSASLRIALRSASDFETFQRRASPSRARTVPTSREYVDLIVMVAIAGSIRPYSPTDGQRTEFAAICFFRVLASAPPRTWSAGQFARWALRAGNRNSLARLRRAAASSDWSLLICDRGDSPLSHFPPGHAGSERSSLPLFLRARQYATRAESRRHGAPVSDRHRAGARNPHQQRCAPPISLLRTTYCRPAGCPAPALAAPVEFPAAVRTMPLFEVRLARRATARLCRPEVGVPLPARRRADRTPIPRLSHFPPDHAGSERSSLPLFFSRLGSAPPRPWSAASDRHRAGARNPHQQRCAPPIRRRRTTYCRPAGCPAPALLLLLNYPPLYGPCRCLRFVSPAALPRGCADRRSAFPCLRDRRADRTPIPRLSHFPPGHAGSERSSLPLFEVFAYSPVRRPRRGAPVSDRHRAGARNPHRRRWPPPIPPGCEPTHRQPRSLTGDVERRPPTGIARARNPHQQRRPANLRFVSPAALRAAVPTEVGVPSRASPCLLEYAETHPAV